MDTSVDPNYETERAGRGLAQPAKPQRIRIARPSDSPRRDLGDAKQGLIVPLVGLRGIIALNVALRHLWAGDDGAIAMVLWALRKGLVGHEFFFVMSGFGLTLSMIRRDEAGRPPSLARYLVDRWWRLAPPYYVALLLMLMTSLPRTILGYPYGPRVGLGHVIAHLAFVHGLWPSTMHRMSLWSISPIFQFYLIFPVLYAVMRKMDYRLSVAGVALCWLAFRASIRVATLGEEIYLGGSVLDRVFPFAAGMGVAHWHMARRQAGAGALSARAAGTVAVGLLGVAVAAQNSALAPWVDLPYGLGYAAFLVAVLVSTNRGGPLSRLLSHPRLIGLGTISYSLYLTHSFVFLLTKEVVRRQIGLTSGLASDSLIAGGSLALAMVFASGFHRLVERPLRPDETSRPTPPEKQGSCLRRPSVVLQCTSGHLDQAASARPEPR